MIDMEERKEKFEAIMLWIELAVTAVVAGVTEKELTEYQPMKDDSVKDVMGKFDSLLVLVKQRIEELKNK